MNSFYEEDLANIHHRGFGEFSNRAGDELLKIFRDANILSGLVIDLGCGSGIWARKLVSEGYSVLGIDASAKMIDIARKTAPKAEFQVSSMYSAELRPCQAITALGEVINYLDRESPTTPSPETLFQKAAAHLRDGGIFAFDAIVQPLPGEEPMQYRSWSKDEDWAVLVEVSELKAQNRLTRDITVFRKIDGCYRRSEERHLVRVLNRSEIVHLLTQAGFDVDVSPQYGDYSLPPMRLAFIGKKRGKISQGYGIGF